MKSYVTCWMVIGLSFILSACASANFSKTGDFQAPARPPDCNFTIFTATPTSPFKEIGLIDFSVSGPDMARRIGQKLVCSAGGNGLILSGYTNKFGYKKGTVIFIEK